MLSSKMLHSYVKATNLLCWYLEMASGKAVCLDKDLAVRALDSINASVTWTRKLRYPNLRPLNSRTVRKWVSGIEATWLMAFYYYILEKPSIIFLRYWVSNHVYPMNMDEFEGGRSWCCCFISISELIYSIWLLYLALSEFRYTTNIEQITDNK